MGKPFAFVDQVGDLSVTLFGSSSCPYVVSKVGIINSHHVRLAVRDLEGMCTADYAPTTSVIPLDDRTDVTADLRVDIPMPFGEIRFTVHPAD